MKGSQVVGLAILGGLALWATGKKATTLEPTEPTPETKTASLSGSVFNEKNEPLAGVVVVYRPPGVSFPWQTVTGDAGQYVLADISILSGHISFEKPGYGTVEGDMTLKLGDNSLNVAMLLTPLPAVRITRIVAIRSGNVFIHIVMYWENTGSVPVTCKGTFTGMATTGVSGSLRCRPGWPPYGEWGDSLTLQLGETGAFTFNFPGGFAESLPWRIKVTLTDVSGNTLDEANSGEDWRQPYLAMEERTIS